MGGLFWELNRPSAMGAGDVLADSANVRDYIKKMRKREAGLYANWGTLCPPLNFGLN
jgi:hypothetical protein